MNDIELGLKIAEACEQELNTVDRGPHPSEGASGSGFMAHEYFVHLQEMFATIRGEGRNWTADKLHRWVGYIQGEMVMSGATTLQDQMDLVRGLKSGS